MCFTVVNYSVCVFTVSLWLCIVTVSDMINVTNVADLTYLPAVTVTVTDSVAAIDNDDIFSPFAVVPVYFW